MFKIKKSNKEQDIEKNESVELVNNEDEVLETQVLSNEIEFVAQINWGKLKEYIEDDDITDIKCNSKSVWIDHVSSGRSCADFNLDSNDIEQIAYQIANSEGVQFNKTKPTLQADYEDLRIQIMHSAASPSGINMTIRKTPFIQRIKVEQVEKRKYCTSLCMDLIKESVKVKLGIVNTGETGAGKTEGTKVQCSFIPEEQGIITVEDTSELHLSTLYPSRNIIELKTYEFMDFDQANNATMRMNPDWVLLSEARDKAISKLLQCRSEGHGILTTLHDKSSTSLVSRIINMYGQDDRPSDQQIENMVHEYFDIDIHYTCDIDKNHTHRYIDEISIYERIDGINKVTTIYKADKNLKVIYKKLPAEFSKLLDKDIVRRWNSCVK